MKKIKLLLILFTSVITLLFNVSCTQVIIGGAASGGIILVQERTPEQAAKDILIKTRLEEAFFSANYDDIFSKIKSDNSKSRSAFVIVVLPFPTLSDTCSCVRLNVSFNRE